MIWTEILVVLQGLIPTLADICTLFSVLPSMEVKFGMQKFFGEFSKQELPFYYHMSSHTLYYEYPRPKFYKAPEKGKERMCPREE